jgi:hypothetical protein
MFIFKIHEAKLQTQSLPRNEGNHKLSAISSAMSITLVSDSFSAFFTPSVSMYCKKGQAAAITWGTGGNGFIGSFKVHSRYSFFLLFEHLCPASTTTQSVAAAAFHFDQFGIQCLKNFTGGFIYIIRSA